MLCLGKESRCPDLVILLEQFIQEVGFWVRRQLGCQFSFILLIGIFYEGWKGTSLAGIYSFVIFPFCIPLCLAVSLAAYAAAQKAPSHLDSPGVKVDLWVVLVQPGEPEYHALFAEAGDCKQDVFGVSVVGHDYVNLVNTSSLIEGSVHIVNQNWLGQLAGRKLGLGDEILVNEVSGGSSINHGFSGQFLHDIRGFQVDQEHDGLPLHLLFPFRLA